MSPRHSGYGGRPLTGKQAITLIVVYWIFKGRRPEHLPYENARQARAPDEDAVKSQRMASPNSGPLFSIRFQVPEQATIIGASGKLSSERLLRLVERASVESLGVELEAGRGDWIRTSGPLHPMPRGVQKTATPC